VSLRTRFTEAYGLEAPIASAGMAMIALPALAAAVSNAGGFGTLGAAMMPPDALRMLIRATRSMTRRPFGVDLITEFVAPEHLDVLVAERPAAVVFFWGLPDAGSIRRLQAADVRVWMQAGSVDEARNAAAAGVDLVIAQGAEGGGHNRSEAATFSLLPAVCDAVAPLPVLAAGGIADGRGLAAALALGADGAWCGSRFLTSEEAHAHPEYKARALAAGVGETVRTTLFGPEWPDQPMRVLRNRVTGEWVGREHEAKLAAARFGSIGTTLLGGERIPLPKFSVMLPTPETEGDFDEMGLTAGESVGNIRSVRPAGDIVRDMGAEAARILARLAAQPRDPQTASGPKATAATG
jgi:NAD(P)H-dependent flavin oxidoreductase YrpB (nitropropane dioxygenase family)